MARRTKIVCTLGPSVDDEASLRALMGAGMDVARFNFSHGSHDEHRARMERLRKVRGELDSPCAMLLDTRGPEIRTGRLAGGRPVELAAGSRIVLTERAVEGTPQAWPRPWGRARPSSWTTGSWSSRWRTWTAPTSAAS